MKFILLKMISLQISIEIKFQMLHEGKLTEDTSELLISFIPKGTSYNVGTVLGTKL